MSVVANGSSAPGAMGRKKLQGFVGFSNLPNQWHRRSVKKGFHFTAMVVGQYLAQRTQTTRPLWWRKAPLSKRSSLATAQPS